MDINIFEILRAKSPHEGVAETLREHIENAIDKTVNLYKFVESIKNNIEWEVFKDDEKRQIFFKALTKAVIFHDFGKIDYKFQRQLFPNEKESEVWQKIEKFFSINGKDVHFSRHEVLSAIYASILLEGKEWESKIITAILFHHYNIHFSDLTSFPEFIYNYEEEIDLYLSFVDQNIEIFKDSYESLLNKVEIKYGNFDFIKSSINELRKTTTKSWDNIKLARNKLTSYEEDDLLGFTEYYLPPNNLSEQVNIENSEVLEFLVFLGALRRVDYSASGDVEIEKCDQSLLRILDFERIIQKFKDKFPTEELWQEEVLKKISNKNLVLIAPTGSGKTEFSILWATKNPKKFLYTLPLRVALNDLFVRFRGKDKKGHFDEEIVDILHSTSFIEYLKEESGHYLDIERKITSSKLLSSPIMLTTPDQIFLTSLNYYGSDKVISVYPMSNIVIDEIQTYNTEMAAIIIKTLQTVKTLGGNILIMTATFPPYFEKFLKDFQKIDVSEYQDEFKIKNLKIKRHCIEVVEKNLFEYEKEDKNYKLNINPDIKNRLQNPINDNKNILIVVNNVMKAIELYKQLNEYLLTYGYKCFLLHSRLVEKYKTKKITEIKDLLSKKQKAIVISTQIIEASVDFDFDFMITELSSIDSQIQRWGRVYRSRNEEFSDKTPNIIIFAGEEENGKLKIDRGTSAIYDLSVLEATRKILQEHQNTYLSFLEEKQMVKETFEKEINGTILKDKYEKEIEENLNFLNYFTVSKKSQAQRIFRKLAGINAVVPALMKDDDEEWVKKFAEFIEKESDISWKEIKEKINANDKSNWELKAKLYEYSVSLPEFSLQFYSNRFTHDFKGFWVLEIKQPEEKEFLKKYGIDGLSSFKNLEENEFDDLFI